MQFSSEDKSHNIVLTLSVVHTVPPETHQLQFGLSYPGIGSHVVSTCYSLLWSVVTRCIHPSLQSWGHQFSLCPHLS